ncbi:helix-turn-helix domain-containing protein [Halobacillus naozhouensis]|uniref:Helix-turn-helix transcriptional regulator n=1 Tax=Halobacillus naozhouensis TaxID=554880 RepID=A0ABY8IXD0_9BACI|nr:helix-turn-helix transcriptional regulator [Halobacillus naozhouensis]WFT74883.1 helix-turn-helix transcriptional regulator [Halobacillus naozhouensis]
MRLIIDNQTFYVIRKIHRLSMKEMADYLNISQSYVNQIEKGREPVTGNVRDKVVNVFGLDNEKLVKIKKDYNEYTIN